MSKEDEVAKASAAAALATEELVAAEEAAAQQAAAKKESSSKRQKQKQKRKAKQEQRHQPSAETEETEESSVPSFEMSRAMLAETTAIAAHYAEIDRQTALASVSMGTVCSEVEFIDEGEGQAGFDLELEVVDAAVTYEGPAAAATMPVSEQPTLIAVAPPANPQIKKDGSSDDERPASGLSVAATARSSDDEAVRQTVQVGQIANSPEG